MQTIRTTILALSALLYSSFAYAGVYADEMSKCVARSSTTDDQILLVQWVFSGFAFNPAVQPLISISPEQRLAFDKGVAAVFQRLLTIDCRTEAVAAIKYEGQGAVAVALKTLGEVAARSLSADPRVYQALHNFATYIDQEKMNDLVRAAGLPNLNAPPLPAN